MTESYSAMPMDLDPLFRTPPPDPNGLNLPSLNTISKSEAAEEELNRLLAEVRKIAGRDRRDNESHTAIARRSPFISIWDKWTAEQTKVGLENPGNLCYRNVAFQLLAHSPAIMRWAWWYNKHHIPEGYECHMGKRGGVCKPCHLHNFFISYWDSREEDFEGNVNRLWKSIHSDLLYHQPDPVKFLHNICEQIARDIPETHHNGFKEIFQIGTVQHMQCLEENSCGHQGYESSANRPILSLELDPKYKIATVDEALQKHFSIKEKSGSCIKCQNKRSDRRCITKPSEILMVQLNRTDDYRRHEHNEDPINFEGNIQLRKEYFDPQAEGIKNITYELTSVILRSGHNTYSGHYTIIVKGRTGKWTLIDDTETKPINFSNFCREPENKKNAYLFVYTRLSRNPSEDRMFRYNKIFTQDRVSKRLGITRKDGPELLNWSSGTRGPPGLLKMMDMVDSGTQTTPGNASALFANTTASSARQEPRTRIVTKSFISDSSSSDSSVASRKQMPRPALFTDSEISDSESNKSASSLSRSELSPMSVTDDGIEPIPRGSERQPSNKEIMESNIELMRLLIAFKNQKKFAPPESYQKKAEESSQPSNADLLSSNIEIIRQIIALKNEKKFCPPESSQKQGEDISQNSTAEILNSNAEIQRSNAEIIRLLKEQKKSSPPQSSRRQGEGQSQPLTEEILSSNAEILRVLKTLKAQKNPPVSETSQKRIGEPSQQQPITAELLSSNAEILKLLKTLKAQKSSSSASRSSKRKDSYLQPVDGTSDPAGPLMTDGQFEMKAYTEGRPYHNKNSWLRIQYIEYQSSDRENPDKSCRVPLDFAVRGYPVNLLKNPCDSGINADLISILGNLKEDDDIMVD